MRGFVMACLWRFALFLLRIILLPFLCHLNGMSHLFSDGRNLMGGHEVIEFIGGHGGAFRLGACFLLFYRLIVFFFGQVFSLYIPRFG